MTTFEINGKEYDLKLDYTGVKYLNKHVEGGAMSVVGEAMQGDPDLFPHILAASLRHTGENFTLKDIEKAIDIAVEEERLDLLGILRISNEVVADNFFYRALVEKSLDKKAKAALDNLLN